MSRVHGGIRWENPATLLRTDIWGHVDCAEAGVCWNKSLADCDDGNPCTGDTCDPVSGCKHMAYADGAVCSDDGMQHCNAGACK